MSEPRTMSRAEKDAAGERICVEIMTLRDRLARELDQPHQWVAAAMLIAACLEAHANGLRAEHVMESVRDTMRQAEAEGSS